MISCVLVSGWWWSALTTQEPIDKETGKSGGVEDIDWEEAGRYMTGKRDMCLMTSLCADQLIVED